MYVCVLFQSKISRLPAYLTIQFVRFYYKEKEAINAKILKDVKFPLEFDAFELCSPELQNKLAPMREKFKEYEDTLVEESCNAKAKDKEDSIKKKIKQEPFWFKNGKSIKKKIHSFHKFHVWYQYAHNIADLGSNNSGYYKLQAVLTHRGRSSSSGHYVGWILQKGDTWMKCDDDVVTAVTTEEVLKLSGGGDWHCAYVLLYGPRILEVKEDNTADNTDNTEA